MNAYWSKLIPNAWQVKTSPAQSAPAQSAWPSCVFDFAIQTFLFDFHFMSDLNLKT